MKAGIYCRVSSDTQEAHGTSLQTQYEAALKYCVEKNYDVRYHFSEVYSGLSLNRPELDRFRDHVRAEAVDVVVVYCLDRLSRNATHGVVLRDELDKHGVLLESVTEDIDKTPLGEAITYLRGTFSQIEAEKIRERTMRGKAACVKQGRLPNGTGIGIYGYIWNKGTKHRDVSEFEARVVREVFRRVAQGDSLLSTAKALNDNCIPSKGKKLWHTLTIRRMIRNRAYIGQTYYKGSLLPDVSPAIVGEDVFNAANQQLDKPKLRTGKAKNEYLLRNHIFCSICGRPMVGHCLNRRYLYYQCSNARPYENQQNRCPARYVRAKEIEAQVWANVKEVLSNPDIIVQQLTQTSEVGELGAMETEIQELGKALRKYEQRRSNLLQAMEMGEFSQDEVLDRLNNLKRLRAEGEEQLRVLTQARDNLAGLANATVKLNEVYDNVLDNLENCDTETKRLALEALDIKAYASPERTEVKGVLPLELYLPTIAQTSALSHGHSCPRLWGGSCRGWREW